MNFLIWRAITGAEKYRNLYNGWWPVCT